MERALVEVLQRPVCAVDLQPPRQLGRLAEELLVPPVADPADALREQQPGRRRAAAASSRVKASSVPVITRRWSVDVHLVSARRRSRSRSSAPNFHQRAVRLVASFASPSPVWRPSATATTHYRPNTTPTTILSPPHAHPEHHHPTPRRTNKTEDVLLRGGQQPVDVLEVSREILRPSPSRRQGC